MSRYCAADSLASRRHYVWILQAAIKHVAKALEEAEAPGASGCAQAFTVLRSDTDCVVAADRRSLRQQG
jgi:hypothetical protein